MNARQRNLKKREKFEKEDKFLDIEHIKKWYPHACANCSSHTVCTIMSGFKKYVWKAREQMYDSYIDQNPFTFLEDPLFEALSKECDHRIVGGTYGYSGYDEEFAEDEDRTCRECQRSKVCAYAHKVAAVIRMTMDSTISMPYQSKMSSEMYYSLARYCTQFLENER